jgi:hypothetical protein
MNDRRIDGESAELDRIGREIKIRRSEESFPEKPPSGRDEEYAIQYWSWVREENDRWFEEDWPSDQFPEEDWPSGQFPEEDS